MPPHSQDTIYLTACPKNRSQYSWTISYCLLSHRGTGYSVEIRVGKGRRGKLRAMELEASEGRRDCAFGI